MSTCKHCGQEVAYHAPEGAFKGGYIPTDPEAAAWGTICDQAQPGYDHEVES